MSIVITEEEMENRKASFCAEHEISDLDIIAMPYDLPIILREEVQTDAVKASLKGHPVLWLPEDLRVMKDNETPYLYALRIYLTLEALGYYPDGINWVDNIYIKIGLDPVEDILRVNAILDDLDEREELMISDYSLKEMESLLTQKAAEFNEMLMNLNRIENTTDVDAVFDEYKTQKGLVELRFSLKELKKVAKRYMETTNFSDIDSDLRDLISTEINAFEYWAIFALREKEMIRRFRSNEVPAHKLADTEKEVDELVTLEIQALKAKFDKYESYFYKENTKESLAKILKVAVTFEKKINN